MAGLLGVLLLCLVPSLYAYNDSIFSAVDYYPRPWFAIDKDQVNGIANNGLELRQMTFTPESFAQSVIYGIANNQRNEVSST